MLEISSAGVLLPAENCTTQMLWPFGRRETSIELAEIGLLFSAAGAIQASRQGVPNCQGGKTRGPEASGIKALEIWAPENDGSVDGLVARNSVRTSRADVTGLTRRCTRRARVLTLITQVGAILLS